MGIVLTVINILLMVILTIMLGIVIFQPKSRAQTAFMLFDIFVMIFVFGLELELLHSDTVDAALSGLCVQYLGQCGFLIALLLFADEFIDMKLPEWIFFVQGGISLLTMYGILTADLNHLFYVSMEIIYEGMYPRISCEPGILWYVHYGYFLVEFIYIIVFCLIKYHVMGPIHRRRIIYLLIGLLFLLIELILKASGLFGAYNPVSIALTGMVLCLMLGLIKEGYFDSIDATMENVLNHGDEGLVVLDAWSRVIFVNDKAHNLFPEIRIGYPLTAQKGLSGIKQDDDLTINDEIWEVRMEDILENNVRTAVMIYFINVTTLVKQSEKLQAVNDERVRFMTKVSHELRSPLNVVLGADEMILRENKDPSIKNYAVMIKEEIGSMVSLVEDIISTSLAEQEILEIKEEAFSLKKMLLHINTVYEKKAEEKSLKFSIIWDGENIQAHSDETLKGDGKRVQQVLINLLDNAVKYTDKGEIKLAVLNKEHSDHHTVLEFSVSDTGNGVPESEQKEIFEKYKRGVDAKTEGREGLGLGLSIVKTFVEAMQGTISLESKPGCGSTFTADIPFRYAETENTESKADHKNVSFVGKKILISDDRPRNILIMKHMLEKSGIVIEEAQDGPGAVKLCRDHLYDALIIDYMMPGMDGGQTLAAIRNDPEGRNQKTYAIVFSANVTPDAEKIYKEEGFADFLSKPVYFDKLVQTLKKAFSVSSDPEQKILSGLQKIHVDTSAGIQYSDGDESFYLELIRSFAKEYEKDKKELLAVYEDIRNQRKQTDAGFDAWKEFTRIAHGIKGELRSFGDSEGGELFYALEQDGKSDNMEDIEKILPEALSHLEQFANAVSLEE